MSKDVQDLAERALFWLGGILADIEAGYEKSEVIAKGRAYMEKLELIRWDGKTAAELQKKLDAKRRRYQAKKLKLAPKA